MLSTKTSESEFFLLVIVEREWPLLCPSGIAIFQPRQDRPRSSRRLSRTQGDERGRSRAMARAKFELRPCGIASGPVAASGHPKAWEFAPDPPKHAIGKFMRQSDRLGEGVLIGITRRLTCFSRARQSPATTVTHRSARPNLSLHPQACASALIRLSPAPQNSRIAWMSKPNWSTPCLYPY